VPGKPLLGVGGAMDLASGARRLIALMTHTAQGEPKIVPRCTLPLTARGVVDLLITDLAVFRFEAGRLALTELMPGATLDEVRASTSARFVEQLGG
jgi:3-oxoacid CoA-transferase